MIYYPGDVGLTRGWGGLADALVMGQTGPGEPPTRVNHALVVVGTGDEHTAPIVEALPTGVKLNTLGRYREQGADQLVVYRPLFIADRRDRQNLVALRARSQVGERYGFDKVVAGALDWAFFRSRPVVRRWVRGPQTPDCSIVVALAYDAIGYRFGGMDPLTVEPDDIDDAVRESEEWICVSCHN